MVNWLGMEKGDCTRAGPFELTPVEPVCRSVPPLLTTFHRDRADRLVGPITGCAQARLDFIQFPPLRQPVIGGPWACRERLPFGQVCFRTSHAPGKVGGLRSGPHSARRPIDRTQQGGGRTGRAYGPPPLVLAAHQRLLPPFPPTNAYRPPAAPAGRPV